jgi:Holliday junction DNA helicase RuvB
VERVEYYSVSELIEIVLRSAEKLNIEITKTGASEIASRSRGTPRIANRLLKRARDYADQRAEGLVDQATSCEALDLLEIDSQGLDAMDRAILTTIIDKFEGGPVGLDTIAASLSEDKGSIEEVCEPFLLQKGFLKRTPRGRVATSKAWEYLGVNQNPRQTVVEE